MGGGVVGGVLPPEIRHKIRPEVLFIPERYPILLYLFIGDIGAQHPTFTVVVLVLRSEGGKQWIELLREVVLYDLFSSENGEGLFVELEGFVEVVAVE